MGDNSLVKASQIVRRIAGYRRWRITDGMGVATSQRSSSTTS